MLDGLSDADIASLANVADQEIQTCLTRTGSGRRRFSEVVAVEVMVRVGMHKVARKWRHTRHFPMAGLVLQTVFTHAAPKVGFTRRNGNAGSCELADLLIVIDDPFTAVPEDRRRAVLVQVKLQAPPAQFRLNRGNERVQFELLSGWPGFKFQASFYKPHTRDLKVGPVKSAWSGEYGVIEQPQPGSWTQYHIIPGAHFSATPPVIGAVTLGNLLAGMLSGRNGYGRIAVPRSLDPWSETVDELLEVTFARPLRGSHPRSKRGRRSDLVFSNCNCRVDGMAPPTDDIGAVPPSDVDDDEKWPDGAVNVVRLIVGYQPDV